MRIAKSFRRDTDRASVRLAMLAQAISSTKPAADSRHSSMARLRCAKYSTSGATFTVQSAFVLGYAASRRLAMVSISLCARAMVVPGRSRA
jgi:hypothetical protein